MFGNMYRFGVEVASEETGIYENVAIVNDFYELSFLNLPSFRVVTYLQNAQGVYMRDENSIKVFEHEEGKNIKIELSKFILDMK